jgi:hypothetical protein
MTTDLATLSYTELTSLNKEVKAALESRSDEAAEAKKDWLKCEKGGGKYLARIEELRKHFNKVAARCNKAKSITLRVKMDVALTPITFEQLLQTRWSQSTCEVFQSDCTGELLNPEACGTIADGIQEQIDNVMGDLCSEVLGIHGDLSEDLEEFVDEWNAFLEEFEDDGGKFSAVLGDIVRTHTKKAAKAKPKGKKK